jgi:exonuclease III
MTSHTLTDALRRLQTFVFRHRIKTIMNRTISPPPAKRRKITPIAVGTSLQETLPITSSAVLPPLAANSLRIFSWNVNGISPFLQPPITSFFKSQKDSNKKDTEDQIHPASLRAFLHRHLWPSIIFLQEVKIASKDTRTQDAVRTAVNSYLPSETDSNDAKGPLYTAHFTLPTDPHNARGPRGSGKVYGVCSIFRRDLHDTYKMTVRTVDWDREGRVSIVEVTSRTTSTKLAIFNIYAVNGTDNLYRDT